MINRPILKAVITGPTGAIGTALCKQLVNNGVQVYAVCRPGSQRADDLPKNPHVTRADCDLESLSNLADFIPGGADVFYHLAWAHTTGLGRNDMQAQIQNVRYTLDAAAAAHKLGCQLFIGAGSQAEYGRFEGKLTSVTPCFPENGYGMAKLCAGQMSRVECQKLGMEHIWTRILSVYGPGDGDSTMISSVVRQLLAGKKPALTAGEQMWDYLYAQDAGNAFYLLGKHGISGKTYVVGSGTAKKLKAYVEQIRDAIDPTLPIGFGEVPYGAQQVMHLVADISELQADTGFCPRVEFSEGIHKTIESIRHKICDP